MADEIGRADTKLEKCQMALEKCQKAYKELEERHDRLILTTKKCEDSRITVIRARNKAIVQRNGATVFAIAGWVIAGIAIANTLM